MATVTTVGLTQPKAGESGGSAYALAPCGLVSGPTHPYAGYLVDSPTVTIIKPKKPVLALIILTSSSFNCLYLFSIIFNEMHLLGLKSRHMCVNLLITISM